MGGIPFLPDQASTIAGRIDALFLFLSVITIVFTVLVALGVAYFSAKYRRRYADEIPPQTTGNTRLELSGMGFLFGLFLVMFFWGGWLFIDLEDVPADTLEIYVIGKKWMWKYEYPDGQQSINDLYVPVGQRIQLTMTSQDVIHSYFVPAFRVKQDVLPGRYSTLWFEATKPGTYHMFCTEYCGLNHSRMVGSVIVLEPSAYEAWLSGGLALGNTGPVQGSPADAGEQLFGSLGCAGCHRMEGQGPGPSLVGLVGRARELASGETVVADATYIRTSILNPNEQVVAGFQPIMPTYQGQVSEEQILQLITYIQSLGEGTGGDEAAPGLDSDPETTGPDNQSDNVEPLPLGTPTGNLP